MQALLFPGQGTQNKKMGSYLFAEFPAIMEEAEAILGYSVEILCTDNPDDKLSNTLYAQPAIYVVNALHYYKMFEGVHVDYLAGHSLGEYNALLAAGVFDFTTGLNLVKKRAELMCQAPKGGMAVILGLSCEEVLKSITANAIRDLFLANYNTNKQVVISGTVEAIKKAEDIFAEQLSVPYIPLNVSHPFHSPLMGEVVEKFKQSLAECSFFSERCACVISNLTARPHSPDSMIHNLSHHIMMPVLWQKSMEYLMTMGVNEYHEVGDTKILTAMLKYI